MQSSQAELLDTSTDDVLSDFLSRLYLASWTSGNLVLADPWRVDVRHGLASFYVVRLGRCWLEQSQDTEPVNLNTGDFVVLTNGRPHSLHGNDAGEPQLLAGPPFPRRPPCQIDSTCRPSAALLCGHFEIHPAEASALRQVFPATVHLSNDSCCELARMDAVFGLIDAEEASPRPGGAAVVSRLVQSLLMQTLRAWLDVEANGEPRGLFFAAERRADILDPVVGPVVRLIHSEPERHWTVPELARRARLSKSAFSERFRRTVGRPPLDYVTEVRMHRACRLLINTTLCVKRVATLVGYESVSAFSSAFKRRVGRAPAAFRRSG